MQTPPAIEKCASLVFDSYRFDYVGLDSQFEKCGLSVLRNLYMEVHDFSFPGNKNFVIASIDVLFDSILAN